MGPQSTELLGRSALHAFLNKKLSGFSLDVCFFIFRQIQPKVFPTCFLNLKTSNDNNNPDMAIVMQEK